MSDWKNIEVKGIGSIEKIVGEFTAYSSKIGNVFIRIVEHNTGHFMGFTNVKIKSKIDGCPEGGVGNGKTIEEALEETLKNLVEMINEREDLKDEDLFYVGYDEF